MTETNTTVKTKAEATAKAKTKLHIVETDGCDFCNNKICDDPVMIFCSDCRIYMNNKMRRRLLKKELWKYGLAIRDDSIMTKKYIRGDEDTSLTNVVDVMLEMGFYLKVTEYRELIKDLVLYHCTEKGLPAGTKIENKDDMNEIKNKAKTIALDRYIRTGHDIDMVPPSLKNKAEIIALETYIDF